MNYIFFDVDGVLNGTDEYGRWIDDEIHADKVERLTRLAKTTNARLVMSSTWRTAWNENGELVRESKWTCHLDQLLREANCRLYSVTPMCNYDRNTEIKLWLKEHANPNDHFVCLDDEYGYYTGDKFFDGRFVHTAPSHCNGAYGNGDIVGLFETHVAQATESLMR